MMDVACLSDKIPKMAAKWWQDGFSWGFELSFSSSFSAQIPQVNQVAYYQGIDLSSSHLVSGSQLINVIVEDPRDSGRYF